MSAHDCVIEFIKGVGGKEIKYEACQEFYCFFRSEFNKFTNTGA